MRYEVEALILTLQRGKPPHKHRMSRALTPRLPVGKERPGNTNKKGMLFAKADDQR